MPRATFTKDFVWKAKRNVRLVYKAGKTYGITGACHAAAMRTDAIVLDGPNKGGFNDLSRWDGTRPPAPPASVKISDASR
jgi:hypothetical protein